jgi:CRP/FNR family transcriptional regulator
LSNNKVLKEIIAMLCTRLRDAWSMVKVMSFADAEHRVKAVLKYMGERFGVPDSRGTIIQVKLTHSDIANFASLSRETATRMINRLVKADEIEALDHKYILLKPAFQKNFDLL